MNLPLHLRPLIAPLLVLLLGCSSADKRPSASNSTSPPNVSEAARPLERETAALRAKQIDRVSYHLRFRLDEKSMEFGGESELRFDYRDPEGKLSDQTHIDLMGAVVHELSINGTSLPPAEVAARYDGARIQLFARELKAQGNVVRVVYTRPYGRTGNGLHRFQDPEDQQVYLYSNFEPYAANQLFACFDQPDLKATYTATVDAPRDWQVITNTRERKKERLASGLVRWTFPESALFSTYLFALHAGPYTVWSDGGALGIPLRLFARRSIAKNVESAEWFEITRQGIEFYAKEFGTAFPYPKYDQVIVPEFNSGAMENVAAVTFAEKFVFRSKVTEEQRLDRADVILHEMAHMWFGNLVTMRWWNGLWLNESFATWAAGHAADRATRFGGKRGLPWRMFFSDMKQWAYGEDQLPSTHPIEVSVPDTAQAFANFDGITYGKGASALKQLRYTLGEDPFREGLVRYFSRFAKRNTTLADFMLSLAESSSQDLGRWQRLWLQTPGLNSVEAVWGCDGDRLSRFVVKQRAPAESAFLRPHATAVGLFGSRVPTEPAARLELRSTERVAYAGAETEVAALIGKPCPQFVFPNVGDHDYVKVILDPTSLEWIERQGVSSITDPLSRQLVWHSLWESVVDARLSAKRFAELALKDLSSERDPLILRPLLGRLASTRLVAPSALKLVSERERPALWRRIEEFARERLARSVPGSDAQLLWWRFYASIAVSPESAVHLRAILDGKQRVSGLRLEQDRRWEIVFALARQGVADASELITAEGARDPSDLGRENELTAWVLRPDASSKREWLGRFLRTTETKAAPAASPFAALSNSKLARAMRGFQVLGQESLTLPLRGSYFESIEHVAQSQDEEYSAAFVELLYPAACESDTLKTARSMGERDRGLPAAIRKHLIDFAFEDERCQRARALIEADSAR